MKQHVSTKGLGFQELVTVIFFSTTRHRPWELFWTSGTKTFYEKPWFLQTFGHFVEFGAFDWVDLHVMGLWWDFLCDICWWFLRTLSWWAKQMRDPASNIFFWLLYLKDIEKKPTSTPGRCASKTFKVSILRWICWCGEKHPSLRCLQGQIPVGECIAKACQLRSADSVSPCDRVEVELPKGFRNTSKRRWGVVFVWGEGSTPMIWATIFLKKKKYIPFHHHTGYFSHLFLSWACGIILITTGG